MVTAAREIKRPFLLSLPGGSDVKESACSVGDPGLIPRSGRYPGDEHGNTLQYYCLSESHGQKSLVGYSPWSPKESDTTEQLTLSLFMYKIGS